jgi:hypothetical protein
VRFATINGLHLALPTLGLSNPNIALIALTHAGTAVGSATNGVGDNTINTAHDDLLAIWDANNGDQVSLQGVEYWKDPIGGLPRIGLTTAGAFMRLQRLALYGA